MSNRWEKGVKISLNDVFDNEEEKSKEEEKSNEEIDIDDIFNTKEEVYFPVEEDEENEEELVETYGFSYDDRIELYAKEIDLSKAHQYVVETKKQPVINDKITEDFLEWYHEYDSQTQFLNATEIGEKIKEYQNKQEEEKTETNWKQEYIYHDICMTCNKEREFISGGTASCAVCDGEITEEEYQKLINMKFKDRKDNSDKYKKALSWLFKFMDNLTFVDFIPSDEDMKKIQQINELVNNE